MKVFEAAESSFDKSTSWTRNAPPPIRDDRSCNRGANTTAPVQQHSNASCNMLLADSCRHLQQPNGTIVGNDVASTIRPIFQSLHSAIPTGSSQHAVASIDGRQPITHKRIRDFVEEFGLKLREMGIGRGQRVAVVLPNGPELALAILAICNWASCVPLNAKSTTNELEADLQRCNATLVMGIDTGKDLENRVFQSTGCVVAKDACHHQLLPETAISNRSDLRAFRFVEASAEKLGIPFCGVVPSMTESGIFKLVPSTEATLALSVHKYLESHSSYQVSLTSRMLPSPDWSCNSESYLFTRETTRLLSPTKVPTNWGSLDSSDRPNYESLSTTSTLVKSPSTASLCSFESDEEIGDDSQRSRFIQNEHNDEVLVLFTSGTTGEKKMVAHLLGDLLVASAIIALSWDLSPDHVNCNLMPLFHVGGIVRQVFAPILSGGSVICCPSFDPYIFWTLLANKAFNWYYATPTMHQMILKAGKDVDGSSGASLIESISPKLRLIANAGGGLPHTWAVELRRVFQANVLPSYGMTECMPISSPPATYELEKPGSSGVPVGPEVAIIDIVTNTALPPHHDGHVCVRGAPCFRGYLYCHHEPERSLVSSFLEGGWFDTGDLGYVDQDGYLYITGRSKEVINRGGEIISPVEVEEAVLTHPQVQACLAFPVRHDILQEVVGIAIVSTPGQPKLALPSLQAYLGHDRLDMPKWPQCLVYMNDLPKSQTNKLLRGELARRLGLPELTDGMSPLSRTFEACCPPAWNRSGQVNPK